jgi:hypothetical protein
MYCGRRVRSRAGAPRSAGKAAVHGNPEDPETKVHIGSRFRSRNENINRRYGSGKRIRFWNDGGQRTHIGPRFGIWIHWINPFMDDV